MLILLVRHLHQANCFEGMIFCACHKNSRTVQNREGKELLGLLARSSMVQDSFPVVFSNTLSPLLFNYLGCSDELYLDF